MDEDKVHISGSQDMRKALEVGSRYMIEEKMSLDGPFNLQENPVHKDTMGPSNF